MLCIFECYRTPLIGPDGKQLLDTIGQPKYRAIVGTAGECQIAILENLGPVQLGIEAPVTKENCTSFYSSDAAGITLSDFPDNYSFGNGVSIGSVSVINGEKRRLNWVVLARDTEVTLDGGNGLSILRTIMEGSI